MARRIRTFPEGKFTPAPPPALLDELTDELIVLASGAVAGVAAESPKLSANAALRLLAWTVADARGADTPLDAALALTVGKRLERQAKSVEKLLERAQAGRTMARELGRDERAAALASIDAAESAARQKARDEVYIGFHELESLLPAARAAEPTSASSPAKPLRRSSTGGLPPSPDTPSRFDNYLREAGIKYFPWSLVEEYGQEDGSIPPDLAHYLGPAAILIGAASRP